MRIGTMAMVWTISLCADPDFPSAEIAQSKSPREFEGQVDLTIGGDGEDRREYTFSTISGIAFAPSGRVVVTDLRENVVRVYEPSGLFAYSVGRLGQGPGEFRNPISVAFSADGLFWVRDEGNRRFNSYRLGTREAVFQTSVRYYHPPPMPERLAPIPFDSAGHIISLGSISSQAGSAMRARFVLDRGGTVVRVDTILSAPMDSTGQRSFVRTSREGRSESTVYYYQPFGPTFLTAHAPNGEMARTVTSSYRIEWFNPNGTRSRILQRAIGGPELSAKERTRGQTAIRDFVRQSGVRASQIPGLPSRKAPIRAMAFDSMGRLWVERSVSDGLPREADVYDRQGVWSAIMRWPSDIDLLGTQHVAAAGLNALGVGTDSLGVQKVVRLRFR